MSNIPKGLLASQSSLSFNSRNNYAAEGLFLINLNILSTEVLKF